MKGYKNSVSGWQCNQTLYLHFFDVLNMCLHCLSVLNMGIHHMLNEHRFLSERLKLCYRLCSVL